MGIDGTNISSCMVISRTYDGGEERVASEGRDEISGEGEEDEEDGEEDEEDGEDKSGEGGYPSLLPGGTRAFTRDSGVFV